MKDEVIRVKSLIKDEYGTLQEFCNITERDCYELKLFFSNCIKKETQERREDLIIIEDEALRNAHRVMWVTDAVRMKIKMGIRRYGGVQKFVGDNPQFKPTFIYDAMLRTKRGTEKMLELLEVLKIQN